MTRLRYAYVNAFTEDPFGGNPCMVFFDAGGPDEAMRLKITRESRLSECAFLQAPEGSADFAVRYYLPYGPIPMAGHPTIATVQAMIDCGMVAAGDAFTLEVGAGVIGIETAARDGAPPSIAITTLAPDFGPEADPALVAAAYGLDPAEIIAPPQWVSTGTGHVITLLSDPEALRRARLDPSGLEAMRAALGCKTEAHLCVLKGATEAGDVFSRMLMPPYGPVSPSEDPFTGSANSEMAAWLWRHGHIASPRLIAEQGHWMDRPGSAEIEALGPPDAIEGVRISGSGVVLMRGEIDIPDQGSGCRDQWAGSKLLPDPSPAP